MKVLAFSPDVTLAAAIEEVLGLRHHEVQLFPTSPRVWEAFQQERHTWVLLETNGPGSVGLSLCRRIRAAAHREQCLIVVIGDESERLSQQMAMRAGADDWVAKTADPESLAIHLARVERRARSLEMRRRAEKTLRAQQHAIETMQLGVTIADLDGTIIYTNEAEALMHGYERDELIGERVQVLAPRESWKALSRDERSHLASWQRETVNVKKDGTRFPVRLLSDVVLDDGGNPLGIVTTCEDITERERVAAELRDSERRYRQLFERNLAGVYRATVDGELLDCNEAFSRMFGYGSPGEAIGSTMSAFFPSDQDQASFISALRSSRVLLNHEARVRRKDGSVMWTLTNASLVPDEAGRLSTVEGTVYDITDRKRMEQQNLLHAQKMEAVGRLAGGVAHDFNNLLQAGLSLTQSLQAEGECPEPAADRLDELERTLLRGAQLTRQLLLFSRRDKPRPEVLDLNEVVEETAALLGRLVRENIVIGLHMGDGPLAVEIDRGRLEQVLMNLAINGSDAMPQGGSLLMRTRKTSAGQALLTVEDTGCGVPEAIRDRIFDPYFTTKDAEQGTGLGLSVVHGIVTEYGGSIEVHTREGVGTRFEVVLPLAADAGAAAETRQPDRFEDLARGGGERVLLVEDEEAARDGLKNLLELLGYTVEAVGTGEEALALVGGPAFDVLLTDLMLPGISGAELSRALDEAWPGISVILMSGHTEEEATSRGILEGRLRFLEKPFGLKVLASEVLAALESTP
jgi:PAS domain S-box-containing protein